MKKQIFSLISVWIIISNIHAQNTFPKAGSVGIATLAPNASAILDIDTTGKGVLIPRMTKAQRNAIVSPAKGLLIFQNDDVQGFYYYNSGWKPVTPPAEVQFPQDNFFIIGNYLPPTTTGNYNTIAGESAFSLNTSGSYNTAFGYLSLALNTSGNSNSAVGYRSMENNSSGNFNTTTGFKSLYNNKSGSSNIAIGYNSMYFMKTGHGNIAIGKDALYKNENGFNLVAIGDSALYNQADTHEEIIIYENTAIGSKALYKNNYGYSNTAVGFESLYTNTTGGGNSATGSRALYYNNSGGGNTAFGSHSLYNNTKGSGNTAIGGSALYNNKEGNYNTAIGNAADVSTLFTITNATALGYAATVNASNKVVIGNGSVSVIGGQVGWSTLSDGRFKKNIQDNVPGLTFINKLKPVNYNIEVKKLEKFLGKNDSDIAVLSASYETAEKKLHTGFIAQEVEKAAQSIHYAFDGVNAPQNEKDNYSLSYAGFIPSLVKAVQELDKENKKLKADIEEIKQMIAAPAKSSAAKSAIPDEKLILGQNQPNPFNNQTIIPVHLPLNVNTASIVITETATGKIIKTIPVTADAKQVSVETASMPAGSYRYTLIADGRKIESKQMMRLNK